MKEKLREHVLKLLEPTNMFSNEFYQRFVDSVIRLKIDEHPYFLNEDEKVLLSQEIALHMIVFYYMGLDEYTQFQKLRLTHDKVTHFHDGKEDVRGYLDNDWSKTSHVICSLFNLSFTEKKDTFTIRFLDGVILTCYSPYYFQNQNIYNHQHQLPLEEESYVFELERSSAPTLYMQTQKYQLSKEMTTFLRSCVISRTNILVCGSHTETNLDILHMLANQIPMYTRITSVHQEKPKNLFLVHHIELIANPSFEKNDLIKSGLRMSTDQFIVDELEPKCTFSFFQACNTGHDGSFSTLTVATLDDIIPTLTQNILDEYDLPIESAIRLISESIDIFAFVEDISGIPSIQLYTSTFNHQDGDIQFVPLFNQNKNVLLEDNLTPFLIDKFTLHEERTNKSHTKKKKIHAFQPFDSHIDDVLERLSTHYSSSKLHKIKPLLKNTIAIHRDVTPDTQIPIGSSKFGGDPDLPSDVSYPIDDIPYSFIMQVNCEEISSFDVENKFPNKGMLYFFHKFDEGEIPLPYDYSGANEYKTYLKSVHIFHYDGDISLLKRTPKPFHTSVERIDSAKVSFGHHYTIPHPSEHESLYKKQGFNDEDIDCLLSDVSHILKLLNYDSLENILNNDLNDYDIPFHQFFGEPEYRQGPSEHELADDLKNRFQQSNELSHKWILFAQFLDDWDIDLAWAADSVMHYYIKETDVLNRNYTSIYSIMQCS